MSKKIQHLVVDTTAFIRAANLQEMAENMYTVQEVIDEITNDRQRRKLVVLPYDLKVKDVFTENIKFITDFSKKTGDYTSLSATDIKVMALAYQIEKEKVGVEHLKTEPTMQRTVKVTGLPQFNSNVDNKTNCEKELTSSEESKPVEEPKPTEEVPKASEDTSKSVDWSKINIPGANGAKQGTDWSTIKIEGSDAVHFDVQNLLGDNAKDQKLAEDIAEQIKSMDLRDGEDVDNLISKVSSDEESDSEEYSESDDSDGGEWITPGNLAEKKKEMDMGEFEEKAVEVATISSDFAMQNVLKQIGLNVTAIDGRIIRQLRTFIFRCTTCFKTTSVMTKLFCPKCGHATLKKVGVSIDEEGNQHIHINGRKPLTARGKRFSLPTPRGGQHFQYPILTEDQHIHKRFATKMARNKTNALDPDYTAGFSPFVMKDVNSKSAVLGVRANKQDVKYWMKNYSKGKKK
ncbi:RNA-binding protein NOB1 [Leguminivora glycinivorella]|uniref:RNA-binding protein NOB1 n=1 Tax=Leguminivora glycinivorella TaxID=1035111 RepID=UPI002010AA51|nr:RNA-binding protein NOB1 [Leguminivora glycinivorella]